MGLDGMANCVTKVKSLAETFLKEVVLNDIDFV